MADPSNFMMHPTRRVEIDYTNHRGERRLRIVIPYRIDFRETPDHKPEQWIMEAWDLGKQAQRTFAMNKIHGWRIL